MLQVWSLSGDNLLDLPPEELTTVRGLKQRLSTPSGVSRFRQQLVQNGTCLDDDAKLISTDNVQLCVVPFVRPSPDQLAELYNVASNGLADVEEVLQRPQDPDLALRHGRTLLHCLSFAGDVDSMALVLEAGADKNLVDMHGKSALHLAAHRHHADAVRLLLEAGIDVNVVNHDRRSALHVAALAGSAEVVRLLVEGGAHMDFVDMCGRSALHDAAAHDCPEAALLLLVAGADKDLVDNGGMSAAQELVEMYARAERHRVAVDDLDASLHIAEAVRLLL